MSYFDVTRREFLAASSAALFVTSWRKAIGETGSPTGHSPFIATDADIEQIRSLIKSNATAAGLYQDLQRTAQGMVAQQPAEYALRGGNILNQSRTSLARTYTLGLLWRLDGNPECLQRALMELRTAASFPDWHTAHFLDTAEMTHAVAAGYSWFYPALSAQDRDLLAGAIIEKGLDPALACNPGNKCGWYNVPDNWNIVCCGGIGLGALAVMDKAPKKVQTFIQNTLASLPSALAGYAPDGGWAEGPAYWGYSTMYMVTYLAGLLSVLNKDFNLAESPGFSEAGMFRMWFAGPCGAYNYADAGTKLEPAPEMFWLAKRFNRPQYAWHEEKMLAEKGTGFERAQHLLWFPREEPQIPNDLPLVNTFSGINVGFLRSSWTDPMALFVGAKGGDNKVNHSHLDLGSFVFDAANVRWAVDLGGDSYDLPEYFGKLRYSYYRTRTESHNTVLFDDANQDLQAKAQLRNVGGTLEIDLSGTYPGKLRKWIRHLNLPDSHTLIVDDQIEASYPVTALWGMVTPAQISLNGRRAILKKDGKTMIAEIESPSQARFDTMLTQPPPPQNPNNGTAKVVVRLPAKVTAERITVKLSLA